MAQKSLAKYVPDRIPHAKRCPHRYAGAATRWRASTHALTHSFSPHPPPSLRITLAISSLPPLTATTFHSSGLLGVLDPSTSSHCRSAFEKRRVCALLLPSALLPAQNPSTWTQHLPCQACSPRNPLRRPIGVRLALLLLRLQALRFDKTPSISDTSCQSYIGSGPETFAPLLRNPSCTWLRRSGRSSTSSALRLSPLYAGRRQIRAPQRHRCDSA